MSANQITLFFILILLVGGLSGSTLYYYNKSRAPQSGNQVVKDAQNKGFQANLPTSTPSEQNKKVDELTQLAPPKGRLSYPSNTYKVGKSETLFAIGNKFLTPWAVLKSANNLVNENAIQSDMLIVIPKLNNQTDRYRIHFTVNEELVSQKNKELDQDSQSYLTSPLEVAKKDALVYWGVDKEYEFKLVEANLSLGTALVEARKGEAIVNIGLIQPKQKGEKGLWVVYYSEEVK